MQIVLDICSKFTLIEKQINKWIDKTVKDRNFGAQVISPTQWIGEWL